MKKTLFALCLSLLFVAKTQAQEKPKEKIDVKYGQLAEVFPRQDAYIQKFRANRFGQFIHWGAYSVPGGVWNGKTYYYASEFLPSSANISPEEWREKVVKNFNPTQYDPVYWAKRSKKLGVKYATITTKHHDGFCLWPSKYTDLDVDITPLKRDLIGEFVEAYQAEGLDVYLYYSVLDWAHPDWRYDIKSDEDAQAFERFKQYVWNQLMELLDRYEGVKGIWIDGTWDQSFVKAGGIFSYELEKALKEKVEGLIVNSRLRADEYGSRHFDSNHELMGDYESGYERRLPDVRDTTIVKMDWEAGMTIAENTWGYHQERYGYMKTDLQLIEMVVRAVALNGNFLLNFGPTPEGLFRPEEEKLIDDIGAWMEKYGKAIYSCGYAGLERQDWGYYTAQKGSDIVNMIVFNQPLNDIYRVKVDKSLKVSEAKIMNTDITLEVLPSVNGEYFIKYDNTTFKDPFVIQIKIEPLAKGEGNIYMPPLI